MLADLYKPAAERAAARPRQGYPLARTTEENRRHWQHADGLAIVSEVTPGVRALLRRRCRYECRTNPYARGLVAELANDIVGTGPRLQLLTPDDPFNSFVEGEWREWADQTGLADRLRLLEETKRRDGECFGLFYRDARLETAGLPAVNLKLLEGDQVAHPWGQPWWKNPTGDDGVECDRDGNPTHYLVLRVHPGDNRAASGRFEADRIPAGDVVHWFKPERPGQLRGVPELAAAIPLFAYLGRLDVAVLAREELAASMSAVLESDLPPGEAEAWEPFDTYAIKAGLMATLPQGWKMKQFDTDRPGEVYGRFVDTILRCIGRVVNVPFNKITGDSSRYNYSSGRLDHLTYYQHLKLDRNNFRVKVLDRVFARWWEEMRFLYPAVAVKADPRRLPPRKWHFDAMPSIDAVKDADADAGNLENGTTSATRLAAESGEDIQDVIREKAREIDLHVRAGVPLPRYLREDAPPRPARQTAPDQEELANAP